MAKSKASKTGTSPQKSDPKVVRQALQVTWVLHGQLKRARIQFLYIGKLLAQVRDENLYTALGHADLADYAAKRLRLGRASLYRYIQVYDWVKQSHPEWLEKPTKGFIPDLSDAADLMWIENELKRTDRSAADRAALEAMRTKGLDGRLRRNDLRQWRHKRNNGKKTDTLAAYLSELRRLRNRAAKVVGMPSEVIAHLDAAIEILKNHEAVANCGFDMTDPPEEYGSSYQEKTV